MNDTIAMQELMSSLTPEWPHDPSATIRQHLQQHHTKLIVLDDDPTGTQTVYDIPVLTEWSLESLCAEFQNPSTACYILTNSRSMPLSQAQTITQQIGQNLAQASQITKRDYRVVSRSDSTLRGHFPGEVQVLADTLAQPCDAWIIAPYFRDGGRYTINDIHYVADGSQLIPAAQTEFAKDAAFGYRNSNLRDWVVEKSQGHIQADQIHSISLETLRQGGPDQVSQQLLQLPRGSICIVNAVSDRDMAVFVAGLLAAEAQGRNYIYRTAASFVAQRIGLAPRPLLQNQQLALGPNGGLIVIGSYVPKSSAQAAQLLADPQITALELNVQTLLEADPQQQIQQIIQQADQLLAQNRDVTIITSRTLITGHNAESSLAIGQQVSNALIQIVTGISQRPRYLLAKGGITSSDLATKALGVRRAIVLGQIAAGVPVWQLGPESRYPQLSYIVFPGNVGGPNTLAQIVQQLRPFTSLH